MKKLFLAVAFSAVAFILNAQTTTTIVGTGTANKLPKFTRTNRVGNSIITDNGKIGINTNTPGSMLHVNGTGKFNDTLTITTMESSDSSDRAATTAFVKKIFATPVSTTVVNNSWNLDGNDGYDEYKFIGSNSVATLNFKVGGLKSGLLDLNTSSASWGIHALLNNYGSSNTAMGTGALSGNESGYGNTSVGEGAGQSNIYGNRLTLIGQGADVNSNQLENATAIGASSRVDCSDCLVLGNKVNVGIGTTNPKYKLEVIGNGIRLEDGNQAAGKVLTSDADGVGTWQDLNFSTNTAIPYNWTNNHSVVNNSQNAVFTVQNTQPYGTGGLFTQYAQKWLADNGTTKGWFNANMGRLWVENTIQCQQISPNGTSYINGGDNGGLNMQTKALSFTDDYWFFGGTQKGKWFLINNGGFVIDGESNNMQDVLSSKFTVKSIVKGAIPAPVMTKAQRNLIPSPAQGLQVFVTDNGGYMSWYNSGWQKVISTVD